MPAHPPLLSLCLAPRLPCSPRGRKPLSSLPGPEHPGHTHLQTLALAGNTLPKASPAHQEPLHNVGKAPLRQPQPRCSECLPASPFGFIRSANSLPTCLCWSCSLYHLVGPSSVLDPSLGIPSSQKPSLIPPGSSHQAVSPSQPYPVCLPPQPIL